MTTENISLLAHLLRTRNDESFREGDFHQATLDLFFAAWQTSRQGDSYSELIQKFQDQVGDLAAFAVLCGKYNQQVENGGHLQYWDNGYAGRESVLHDKMMDLMETLGAHKTAQGAEVYRVMSAFDGQAWDDYENPYDHLDDAYYEVCEEWMSFLNEEIRRAINAVPVCDFT